MGICCLLLGLVYWFFGRSLSLEEGTFWRQVLFALFALSSVGWLAIWFPEAIVAAYVFAGRVHDKRLQFEELPMSLNQLLLIVILYLLVVHRDRLVLSMRLWSTRGFILFVIWMSVSLLWTMGPEYGRYKVVSYTGVVLLAVTCQTVLVQWRGHVGYAVLSIWLIGLALTVLGLGGLVGGEVQRLSVLGGGPNIYSRMVGMVLIFSIGTAGYLWKQKRLVSGLRLSARRALLVASIAISLASAPAFIFAQSRGPTLALLVAILFYLVVLLKADFKRVLLVATVFATVVWVASASLGLSGGSGTAAGTRFDVESDSNWNTVNSRVIYARKTLDIVVEHPQVGVGVGGWPVAMYGIDRRRYPHNLFLEMLAELGLVVTLAVLLLFSTQVVLALRTYLSGEPSIAHELLLLCAVTFVFFLGASQASGDIVHARSVWQFLVLMELARRSVEFGSSLGLPLESRW